MDENNFVVKTIFHARGSSEVLTENYFAPGRRLKNSVP